MTSVFRPLLYSVAAVAALLIARPALAGPPLVCFPFDIGAARSLPMGTHGWESIDPTYDVSRLVDDTLALLAPETPVLVRMETLRRATIYASKHPAVATALLQVPSPKFQVPSRQISRQSQVSTGDGRLGTWTWD